MPPRGLCKNSIQPGGREKTGGVRRKKYYFTSNIRNMLLTGDNLYARGYLVSSAVSKSCVRQFRLYPISIRARFENFRFGKPFFKLVYIVMKYVKVLLGIQRFLIVICCVKKRGPDRVSRLWRNKIFTSPYSHILKHFVLR